MEVDRTQTQNAVNIFNKYARQYHERFRDVSLYASSLDHFCDHIPQKDAAILELACGPGNITRYVLKKRPDFQLTGTDLAPNMLAIAELINPSATFMLLDCREIQTLNKKFHGVICGFCLPYLSAEETAKLFETIYSVLHPGGMVYISTMEDDYTRSGIQTTSAGEQMYLYYHEEKDLRQRLEQAGFSITNEDRKKYVDHHGNHTTDLLIVAAKK